MRKTLVVLTYTTFIIASLALTVIFVTSQTYSQLAIATVAYPLLVFLTYKTLPQTKRLAVGLPTSSSGHTEQFPEKAAEVGIADVDKRVFLKLIGATGLSFFLVSLFTRRTEDLFFDKIADQPSATKPQRPIDGYTIAEIDDSSVAFYGFINDKGAWYIMREDSTTGSFRYSTGESNFESNWISRDNLHYKYYHEAFAFDN